MYIKRITLNNFRIYKGENTLDFNPEKGQNVFIVSGYNGFGKTTLLTSLVWCLYGKNMQEVDNIFKEKILSAGGYKKFLNYCLNRNSYENDDLTFSVTLTLGDIEIPGVNCEEIEINRSYYYNKPNDELDIKIDGFENELVNDSGKEFFIQDFVLPREIAKFFFFDAEKITNLAEIKSVNDKRQLSKAYSEILGIKKYEDLRNNLKDLRIKYRKDSASEKDKKSLEEITDKVNKTNALLEHKNQIIKDLQEEKNELKKKSDYYQEKLIREGSELSVEEIKELRLKKEENQQEFEELKTKFKNLLEIAPFAFAGGLMKGVETQIVKEEKQKQSKSHQKLLKEKGQAILADLNNEFNDEQEAYQKAYSIVANHLFESNDQKDKPIKSLHNFSEDEKNQFKTLIDQLRNSFPKQIKDINRQIKLNRSEYHKISRKLSDAESKENDRLIKNYREEKEKADERLREIENNLTELQKEIGGLENEYTTLKRKEEELSNKVKVSDKYEKKDQRASQLIQNLESFLSNIKQQKKNALEEKIRDGLQSLMHKESFVNSVKVELDHDIIDIELLDSQERTIAKEDLSKGEQQLYATALLNALVKESQIEFPVFIDSPLQKFDNHHAKKIISDFYPTVSKQVVILPLIQKELSQDEYKYLINKVKSTYVIHNYNENQSYFEEVNPAQLFQVTLKEQDQNVFEHQDSESE